MKSVSLVLLLLLAGPAFAVQPGTMPPEIGAAYGRLGKAIASHDADAARQVWAEDFVVNAPANVVLGREQVIAVMNEDFLEYRNFKKHITRIDQKAEAVIVMGYDTLVPLKGPGAGKRVTRPFTDVWVQREGRWWLVARQATIAAVE